MGKLAFIFSGQGAQYPGMGRLMAQEYKSAGDIFEKASFALNLDMKKMVFEGDEETLKITENTQPAILTASAACLAPLLEKGIRPDAVAGLSLGEYTAHVASGSMDFEDAVRLVRKRGKFMQEAVPVGTGTMAAILGLENAAVEECCKAASTIGVVEPANYNCPGQLAIAGEVKAVEKAVELAKEKGAKRAMLLAVSAPFHCSLLKPAGENLKRELESVRMKEMSIPVVANVTAQYTGSKDMIKDLLVRQVSSPVLWEQCVRRMLEDGVDTFVEIGPGKVLSGFIRKINKEANICNVEDPESLKAAIENIHYKNT